jgi:hypothetical protein
VNLVSESTTEKDELVFVVDVTSFTEKGFIGSCTFEGKRIDIEFDDDDAGLSLDADICTRIGVRKGSSLTIVVEDDQKIQALESKVTAVKDKLTFSNEKLYYLVGRLGGAIIRLRKA